MTDRSLTLTAPAKINLYLGVHTERDDRGYHRVDSLMAAVGLSDTVTVTPAQALTVQTVPASDFPMQKNTAYRAAVAMAEHYGREANICVTIEKRIPLSPWRSSGELIAPTPRSTTLRGALVPTSRSFCTRALRST
mgnify:CR=1 FL=1